MPTRCDCSKLFSTDPSAPARRNETAASCGSFESRDMIKMQLGRETSPSAWAPGATSLIGHRIALRHSQAEWYTFCVLYYRLPWCGLERMELFVRSPSTVFWLVGPTPTPQERRRRHPSRYPQKPEPQPHCAPP